MLLSEGELVNLNQSFLSPVTRDTIGGFLKGQPKGFTAAALFSGWGAEVLALLDQGAGRVDAVDLLQELHDVLAGSLASEDLCRVQFFTLDALAFLLMTSQQFDVITALGGGPSYVGQGALLVGVKERLKPGGVLLVGDLVATDESRRKEASDLFGLPLPYLLTQSSYTHLIERNGFDIVDCHLSETAAWADYFERMETCDLDCFPFNDEAFKTQMAKEKASMLTPNPCAAYMTWKLTRRRA